MRSPLLWAFTPGGILLIAIAILGISASSAFIGSDGNSSIFDAFSRRSASDESTGLGSTGAAEDMSISLASSSTEEAPTTGDEPGTRFITVASGSGSYTPPDGTEPEGGTDAETLPMGPARLMSVSMSEPQSFFAQPGRNPGEVILSWEPPMIGADLVRAYSVMRGVTPVGSGIQVGSTTLLGFVDATPSPGGTYYYSVTPHGSTGTGLTAGPTSVVSYPGAPALPTPELSSFALVGIGLIAIVGFAARLRR